MSQFNTTYIVNYFTSRGWKISREGNLFKYLIPPKELSLPKGYQIEIPKDENDPGFDKYIMRFIDIVIPGLPLESTPDDFRVLFSKTDSIIKYRIFDDDNKDGTIELNRHLDSLEAFKKALSQAVTFVVTEKPIFGDAKFEVKSYLNRCRIMQTEKGSFITKIEIPNDKIYSTYSVIETTAVNNRLFDAIEFIGEEVISTKTLAKIDANYLSDKKRYINFELLKSIKEVYSKGHINNIEYQLASNIDFRKVEAIKIQPKIKLFERYLRDLKKILLEIVPLKFTGFVSRLTSIAPLTSRRNEIIVDTEISNVKEKIKVILRSEEYLEAIEAHKNEWPIKIEGMAKQNKTNMTIVEPETFEVIKKATN